MDYFVTVSPTYMLTRPKLRYYKYAKVIIYILHALTELRLYSKFQDKMVVLQISLNFYNNNMYMMDHAPCAMGHLYDFPFTLFHEAFI